MSNQTNNDSKFMNAVEKENQAAVSKQVADEPDYNQEADVNFDEIGVRNKHFIIKAPKRKTDSGIILSEEQQKKIQAVSDTPGFDPNIYVVAAAEDCSQVTEDEMVLLSPHVQAMEVALDTDEGDQVLYLMIHEDYVLLTKPRG